MNIESFERIEDYLNGNMNSEERTLFEADLTQDKDLAEAFVLYRSIEENMRSTHQEFSDENSLRQTLEELGAVYFAAPDSAPNIQTNEVLLSPVLKADNANDEDNGDGIIKRKERASTLPIWIKVAVAASVIGILALGIVWFLPQKSTELKTSKANTNIPTNQVTTANKSQSPVAGTTLDSTAFPSSVAAVTEQNKGAQKDSLNVLPKAKRETLFARYFKPDAPPEQHDEFLNDAVSFYRKEEYAKAAAEFDPVASTSTTRGETPDDATIIFQARYYQALSYLALGNATKAITILKKASTDNHLLRIKVQWYLALAYLKNNQVNEARHLLTRLAQRESRQYRQKAENLLKELTNK